MDTQVPENYDATSDDDLRKIKADLVAEFDDKYDGDAPVPLAELTEIADAVDAIDAEITNREAQAEADAAEREKLAGRVRPADTDTDETDSVDATDQTDETLDDLDDNEVAEVVEKELVTASTKPARASARALATRTVTPPPADGPGDVSITAAADIPGVTNGSKLDRTGVARAMMARARGLANHSPRVGVASINLDREFTIKDGGDSANEVITAAVDAQLRGKNASALVASGGWCTPSQVMYDLFSVESRDGLLDLPTVGIERGGIQVPSYIGLDGVAGALWTWSEASDETAATTFDVSNAALASNVATLTIGAHDLVAGQTVTVSNVSLDPIFNGTFAITAVAATTISYAVTGSNVTSAASTGDVQLIKGCYQVDCPTWEDYRLTAEGLCITAGNLIDRAYPELVTRTVDLAVTAHLHRLSNAALAKIVASISAGNKVTAATAPSDAAGDILAAIDLQVADYRSQYLMGDNTVLDALFPQWVRNAIRSTLAMRAGVDMMSVSDAEVTAFFTARNVRPQFLAGYDALYRSSTAATAFPGTSKFIIMPAGGYVMGDGGTIDLGVVRDSTLNATNDYTAAWTEQFYSVMQMGPEAREVTVTTEVTGQTGGPAIVATAS